MRFVEVHAVDDLDNAVIAAAGLRLSKGKSRKRCTSERPPAPKGKRIEEWFADALADMETDFGLSPHCRPSPRSGRNAGRHSSDSPDG